MKGKSVVFSLVAFAALFMLTVALVALAATQTDIVGPPGSEQFGETVTVLPNGNIVVADPYYDAPGPITDTGAVYLYDGATGALISRLTGSTVNNQVGSGGVVTLINGNYIVLSPEWDNGVVEDVGAATWGNGTTGITGVVTVTNSLVGSTVGDQVGAWGVTALSNGNYVVRSPDWDNGVATNAGAATWGNGTTGITGVVSVTNSLVGSTADDSVGYWIMALSNSNYVVNSYDWDNGAATDAGAVTWGNGTTGISGVVTVANSLVGSTADDQVGYFGVTALSNGHYVVPSPWWDNGALTNAGAATWGNGTTGITGAVSVANSLVGSTVGDQVGGGDHSGIRALSNGNYVVFNPWWDNGAATDAGAATWGNGTTGITGAVSVTNSLVGSTAGDWVGWHGVTPLANGNYVVRSPYWDNGAVMAAGAATWGNGTTGITGAVSVTNSLVGSTVNDYVSSWGATALSNGNYVVLSPYWDNGGMENAGAATWGNGATGITGVVTVTNSLVGSTTYDSIGNYYVTELSNGNYVVLSRYWDNGAVTDVGAVTWGNGTTGISGVVTVTNSLVGSTANDWVGYFGVTALSNGNYVVSSPYWDNGVVMNAGAVTWGNGATGISGVVTVTNSLVGSTANDYVGGDGITALSNGHYVVNSPMWDNGAAVNAGAATWMNGTTGISGVVTVTNSLVGSTANDYVGDGGITALSNGHYVVNSPMWDNGAVTNAGAATWMNGTTGITGIVSVTNSLVGSMANDHVGDYVTVLSNGNYVVNSYDWDNGATANAGAVTWGDGYGDTRGAISAENSVRGTAADGGYSLVFDYDYTHHQLVVGRPADNIVTLFRPIHPIYLPVVLRS